jgi:hypothetical protein
MFNTLLKDFYGQGRENKTQIKRSKEAERREIES